MCYPLCGMVHIKDPFLLIEKRSSSSGCFLSGYLNGRKEGNVLFNDALNTFYLVIWRQTQIARGNPLPPHELLFPISSKGYFICIIP